MFMQTMKDKEGCVSKTWIITGSSRGLGRALAEAALAAGEKVAATARRVDGLKDLKDRSGIGTEDCFPDTSLLTPCSDLGELSHFLQQNVSHREANVHFLEPKIANSL